MASKITEHQDKMHEQINDALNYRSINIGQSIEMLEKLYKQGSDLSAWYLGDIYFSGEYCTKDLGRAEFWYKKCMIDDPVLDFTIGQVHFEQENLVQSFIFFQKSARQNYAPGFHKLGEAFYYGYGVDKNQKIGIEMIKFSSLMSYIPAMRSLALIRIKGGDGILNIFTGLVGFCSISIKAVRQILGGASMYEFKEK